MSLNCLNMVVTYIKKYLGAPPRLIYFVLHYWVCYINYSSKTIVKVEKNNEPICVGP